MAGVSPDAAFSCAFWVSQRESAAVADGARSFDSASCTRPSSRKTCGWRRTSLSETDREGVGDGECPHVGGHLREEHALEDVVADLFAQRREIAALDRIDDLVGLLEHVLAERLQRLLAVPRASLGRAQRGHDLDEAGELGSGVRHVFPHGTIE